jgi:hypothetical protein
VLSHLRGEGETAEKRLREALSWIEHRRAAYDCRSVICMMLLESSSRSVSSRDGLPVDAAILLNLCATGSISPDDARHRLSELYPQEYQTWLTWLAQGNDPCSL